MSVLLRHIMMLKFLILSSLVAISMASHIMHAMDMMYQDKCMPVQEAAGEGSCDPQTCDSYFLSLAKLRGVDVQPAHKTDMFKEKLQMCHMFWMKKSYEHIMAIGGDLAKRAEEMRKMMEEEMDKMGEPDKNNTMSGNDTMQWDEKEVAETCYEMWCHIKGVMMQKMMEKHHQMKAMGVNPQEMLGEEGMKKAKMFAQTMECANTVVEKIMDDIGLKEVVEAMKQMKKEAMEKIPEIQEVAEQMKQMMGGEEKQSVEQCYGTLMDNAKHMKEHMGHMMGEKNEDKKHEEALHACFGFLAKAASKLHGMPDSVTDAVNAMHAQMGGSANGTIKPSEADYFFKLIGAKDEADAPVKCYEIWSEMKSHVYKSKDEIKEKVGEGEEMNKFVWMMSCVEKTAEEVMMMMGLDAPLLDIRMKLISKHPDMMQCMEEMENKTGIDYEAMSAAQCFPQLLTHMEDMKNDGMMGGESMEEDEGEDEMDVFEEVAMCHGLIMKGLMEKLEADNTARSKIYLNMFKKLFKKYQDKSFEEHMGNYTIADEQEQYKECYLVWQEAKEHLSDFQSQGSGSHSQEADNAMMNSQDFRDVVECSDVMVEEALRFKNLWNDTEMEEVSSSKTHNYCMYIMMAKFQKVVGTLNKAREHFKDHDFMKKKKGPKGKKGSSKENSREKGGMNSGERSGEENGMNIMMPEPDDRCGLCGAATSADILLPVLKMMKAHAAETEGVMPDSNRRKRQAPATTGEGFSPAEQAHMALCNACESFTHSDVPDLDKRCCTIFNACKDLMETGNGCGAGHWGKN